MNSMILLDASAATSGAADPGSASWLALLTTLAPLLLLIVFFYFFIIRPQKKRDRKDAEMRNSLQVGDEITTIGGIVGIVVSIKEDTVVIETGSDRSKLRIKKTAIQTVETIHETDNV